MNLTAVLQSEFDRRIAVCRYAAPQARYAEFRESDHPRADDGKFGSGGGGADAKPGGDAEPGSPAAAPPAAPEAAAPPAESEEAYNHRVYLVGKKIRNLETPTPEEIASLRPEDQAAFNKTLRERKVHQAAMAERAAEQEKKKVLKVDRKSPHGIEAVSGQFSHQDKPDDYLYHVTTAPRATKILKQGFKTGVTSSMDTNYQGYSAGKMFFADRNGVSFWHDTVTNHLEAQSDKKIPKLVVLRVPKGAIKNLKMDAEGTRDSSANAFYSEGDPVIERHSRSALTTTPPTQQKPHGQTTTKKVYDLRPGDRYVNPLTGQVGKVIRIRRTGAGQTVIYSQFAGQKETVVSAPHSRDWTVQVLVERHARNRLVELFRREYDRRARYSGDFVESEHPRDNSGEFTSGGGGGGGAKAKAPNLMGSGGLQPAEHSGGGKDYKLTLAGGKPLPEHLKDLRLPPAWTEVHVNPHPGAVMVARGKDEKGRKVSIQSVDSKARNAAAKWARVRELATNLDKVISDSRASGNPDVADVVSLIRETGIRPGSKTDTKAEKQAYGATTLQGQHIVPQPDGTVRMQFTGKKGVSLDLPVKDKKIAKMLMDRKAAAGPTGDIFNVDSGKLRGLFSKFDGGGFKPKDLRTLKGTTLAQDLVRGDSREPPKTLKEFKTRTKEVAREQVSKVLGNTPIMALQAYIDPSVFHSWQVSE